MELEIKTEIEIPWSDTKDVKESRVIIIVGENPNGDKAWTLLIQLYYRFKDCENKFAFMGSSRGFDLLSDFANQNKDKSSHFMVLKDKEFSEELCKNLENFLHHLMCSASKTKNLLIFEIHDPSIIKKLPDSIFMRSRQLHTIIIILCPIFAIQKLSRIIISSTDYCFFSFFNKNNQREFETTLKRFTHEELDEQKKSFFQILSKDELFKKKDVVFGFDRTDFDSICYNRLSYYPVATGVYFYGMLYKQYDSLLFKESIYRWRWISRAGKNNCLLKEKNTFGIIYACKTCVLQDYLWIYWIVRHFFIKDIAKDIVKDDVFQKNIFFIDYDQTYQPSQMI